jgi:membrane fusion protein, multidrug efflux system
MLTTCTPQSAQELNIDENRHSSVSRRHCSTLALATLAGITFALNGCGNDKKAEEYVRPVKAIVLTSQSGEIVRTFSGTVRARVESNLGFRVPGKILERKVNIGDIVTVGQVIAQLDNNDLLLTENSAKAGVAAARTRLAVAKDAYNRAKALLPKGYTAKAVVDQRQLEQDAAQSALDAAEAQASQATNATQYATLNTHKNGIISGVYAEAGQVIAAGTPVVTLAEAGETEVALSVPEQDVAQLTIGTPVEISLWADRNLKTEGRIREIAGQADTASRTYAVRTSIIKPPATLRLGMTASVNISLGKETPHVVVPLTALTQVDGRDAVFVVDRASSTVASRFITQTGVTDQGVKISSGVQAGDIVVTAGVQFLSEGKKVRLPEEMKTAVAEAVPAAAQ